METLGFHGHGEVQVLEGARLRIAKMQPGDEDLRCHRFVLLHPVDARLAELGIGQGMVGAAVASAHVPGMFQESAVRPLLSSTSTIRPCRASAQWRDRFPFATKTFIPMPIWLASAASDPSGGF